MEHVTSPVAFAVETQIRMKSWGHPFSVQQLCQQMDNDKSLWTKNKNAQSGADARF